MSDNATLRRLLREHAEAVSTEIAIIKEDAILRLFDAVQNEYAAQVAALTAALDAANEALKFAQAYWMQAVDERDKANEDAARLAIVAADGSCCVLHDRWLNLMMDEDEHTADCPITLHRARVGGLEK